MPPFDYEDIRREVERAPWEVEDVCLGDALDFGRPFLPERLASTAHLPLTPNEALTLNQIRGHGYVRMLALAEAFILPFVLDLSRARLRRDPHRLRALLGFASTGAKHLELFRRLGDAFEHGFVSRCEIVGPEDALAREVLRQHPLTIALMVLHVEESTEAHHEAALTASLEPHFARLLTHHRSDASQHAKLIANVVDEIARQSTPRELVECVVGYVELLDYLDAALSRQVELDLASLKRATGASLDADALAVIRAEQLSAQRRTFLGLGMTQPGFVAAIARLGDGLEERVRAASARYL